MQLQLNRNPYKQQPQTESAPRFASSAQEIRMPDGQKTRPNSGGGPEAPAPGGGPATPKVDRPNVDELLKKMRKVDPDQAKKYRQRTGQ